MEQLRCPSGINILTLDKHLADIEPTGTIQLSKHEEYFKLQYKMNDIYWFNTYFTIIQPKYSQIWHIWHKRRRSDIIVITD